MMAINKTYNIRMKKAQTAEVEDSRHLETRGDTIDDLTVGDMLLAMQQHLEVSGDVVERTNTSDPINVLLDMSLDHRRLHRWQVLQGVTCIGKQQFLAFGGDGFLLQIEPKLV